MRAASCALLLQLAACGGKDPDAPREVDISALDPGAVVSAVLTECHAGLRGMDQVLLQVTLPAGTVAQVQGRLPDRLRIQSTDGSTLLLRDGVAYALRSGTAVALQGDDLAQAKAIALLCDAAALGPLHRVTGVERTGAFAFALTQPDGSKWSLHLQPNTLLVDRLRGPLGEVRILEHLHTATTWMVRRAEIAPLGACTVQFISNDVAMDEQLFALPNEARAASTPEPKSTAGNRVGGEARPKEPQLDAQKAARWLICDDPGDWPSRAAVVQQRADALAAAGQKLAGFPFYFRDGNRACLGIGFRAQAPDKAWSPPQGWEVREQEAGRVLVVFPEGDNYEARLQRGEAQLRAALAEQKLEALGPIRAQPYLHLEEGLPAEEKRNSPVVRMSVRVR
jgi:hypothetical protein